MFSDFFAALSLCGTRNSYIIPVFIRNVNSFSNIFLFYSPKGFLLSFRVKQSVITSQSASQTAPLPRGASGEKGKLSDMPKPPLDRGGGTASAVTERFIQKEPPSRILSTKAALIFTLREL